MTVPSGYTALARGTRRVLVRDELVPHLGPWLLSTPLVPPAGAAPIAGGRGAAFRVVLAEGGSAIVRFGRRGGIVARVVRTWYAGLRPRPWRELTVSLAARPRGAPVPDVLAACVHGWGLYRSAVVTRELAGVDPALDALRCAASDEGRARVARAAGRAVARLHAAGVAHADLNLSNILVGGGEAAIVDLDRARLRAAGLSTAARRRSLRRLARSARKLDPTGAVIDAAVVRAFHRGYDDGAEGSCVS